MPPPWLIPHSPHWVTPHPSVLRLIPLSYASSQWVIPHPSELRLTLLSYASPHWAKPNPTELRLTHWTTPLSSEIVERQDQNMLVNEPCLSHINCAHYYESALAPWTCASTSAFNGPAHEIWSAWKNYKVGENFLIWQKIATGDIQLCVGSLLYRPLIIIQHFNSNPRGWGGGRRGSKNLPPIITGAARWTPKCFLVMWEQQCKEGRGSKNLFGLAAWICNNFISGFCFQYFQCFVSCMY